MDQLVRKYIFAFLSLAVTMAIMIVLVPLAAIDYAYRVKFLSHHEYEQPEPEDHLLPNTELFHVLTEDGFVLTLKHIVRTHNEDAQAKLKKPLLLLSNVPSTTLPLVFIKSHDVWIGYGRMSNHSDHVSLSTSDTQFWDSWDPEDMTRFDYPKFISFVQKLTNWREPIDVAAFGFNATLICSLLKSDNQRPEYLQTQINKIVLLDPMDSKEPGFHSFWLQLVSLMPLDLLCGFECFRLHFIDVKDMIFTFIQKYATFLIPVVNSYNWIQRCLLVYLLECNDYKWQNYKENELLDSLPSLNSLKKTFEYFKTGPHTDTNLNDLDFENLMILKSKFSREERTNLLKQPTDEKIDMVLYHHFDFVYANDIHHIITKKLLTFFER